MLKPLLAKSPASAKLTLEGHLSDVILAAERMFGRAEPTRLCLSWFSFFRIESRPFARFVATLRAAAALHDLGKANDGFQDAVRHNGDQAIRHEHLSALMIFDPTVWNWLVQDEAIDWQVVLSAVLTHHQKCLNPAAIENLSPSRKHISTPADSSFSAFVARSLGRKSECPPWRVAWTFSREYPGVSVKDRASAMDDELNEFDRILRKDTERRRFLRAIRAALICADAAASGLRREGIELTKWIEGQFEPSDLCTAKYIDQEIIQKRKADLVRMGKWKGWHQFQEGAAKQSSRTLLLAPCGAGKTLAAWRWIQEQARLRAAKRVIFLYPTRATATEGFKDYVAWAPDTDAALIHGTGAYELDGMFDNPPQPDERSDKDFGVDPRLFAVAYWSKRVFAGTVDQFMAFLHHAYGPTCLLPVLVDSIVVIDEVHSFDDAMFSSLKAFLQEFNVPVLCMTATLLKANRHQLETQCAMKTYEDRPEDLKEIADAPRYAITRIGRDQAEGIVRRALSHHKRVLWVVNRVAEAQAIARKFGVLEHDGELFTAEGKLVLCYHSRFTLDDRKNRHRRVVDAFKAPEDAPPQAILAVTTQVCEMSLDLDADVLISELCPVTSLVQRAGRCNRKSYVPAAVGEVYLYAPESEMPYEKSDIRSAEAFVDGLLKLGRHASQSDLESLLQPHGRRPPQGDRPVPFVTPSPYADGKHDPFRDIEEHCVQGVLSEQAYVESDRVKRPGLILPVPRKLSPKPCTHKDARRLVIAPASNYSPTLGLCDQPIGGRP